MNGALRSEYDLMFHCSVCAYTQSPTEAAKALESFACKEQSCVDLSFAAERGIHDICIFGTSCTLNLSP